MKQQLTTFYIVRHGETIWNIEQRVQGHTDNPLTPKGEEQAKDLARELKKIHLDMVFSSDFLRAKRTAEIIVLKKHIKVQTAEALRERKMGIFSMV